MTFCEVSSNFCFSFNEIFRKFRKFPFHSFIIVIFVINCYHSIIVINAGTLNVMLEFECKNKRRKIVTLFRTDFYDSFKFYTWLASVTWRR